MQSFVEVSSGVLAVTAAAGALGLLVVRVLWPMSAAGRVAAAVSGQRRLLSALIGTWATLASLYFSEIAELIPCRLCWFQRTMMYPIAVVAVVAWIRRDSGSRWYLGALAAIGLVISLWHNLVEVFPTLESDSCGFTAPCSLVYFRVFGVLSLATMAACGFFAVLVLNAVSFPHGDLGTADDTAA